MAEPQFSHVDDTGLPLKGFLRCFDCGNLIYTGDREAHIKFHKVLSDIAIAVAILQNTHMTPKVHNRYDSNERIKSRQGRGGSNVQSAHQSVKKDQAEL